MAHRAPDREAYRRALLRGRDPFCEPWHERYAITPRTTQNVVEKARGAVGPPAEVGRLEMALDDEVGLRANVAEFRSSRVLTVESPPGHDRKEATSDRGPEPELVA